MERLPEACPVRDVLKEIDLIVKLLDKILSHCIECLAKGEK